MKHLLWFKHNVSKLRYYAPKLAFCSSLANLKHPTVKPNLMKIILWRSGTLLMPTSAVRMGRFVEFKFRTNRFFSNQLPKIV